MPSTNGRRPRLGLLFRMLVSIGLLAVVTLVLVGAEAVFFGLITYGFLTVVGAGAEHVFGDAAGLVVALVAYVLLLVVVIAAYTASRESDAGFAVAPNLLVYANTALIIASLAATYLILGWLGVPNWVFGVLVVSLLAMVYPMIAYQTAGGLSGTDDGDDGSPPWASGVDPADEPSPYERAALLRSRLREMAAGVTARLGPSGTLLLALVAVGGFSAVYLLAAVRSLSGAVVPVTVAVTSLVVLGHVADVARTELANAVVRRELDATFRDVDDASTAAALDERVTRLAVQANLPAPDVRLVSSPTPTAVAVGYRPGSSTVFLSSGLVGALDGAELDAVIAHELGHVANRDAAVLTALSFPRVAAQRAFDRYGINPVMAIFAGVVSLVGRVCAAMVARAREFAADDAAVAITGDPAALANALETLDATMSRRPARDLRSIAAFSVVPPAWEEHRFFDRTRRIIYRGLLGTHPPTERRVERLRRTVTELETEPGM